MANVKKPAYYTLYSLTCKINNKMYIGVCRWYHQRIGKHLYDLRRGEHLNCYLQQDFNIYRESSFVFDIIQKYKNKHEATLIEKYYTDVVFRLNKDYCYNILSGGSNIQEQITKIASEKLANNLEHRKKISEYRAAIQTGKTYSDESKLKMRNSALGRKASNETKKKMSLQRQGANGGMAKKVINTDTGKIYGCLKDAAIDVNMNYDTVRARINGYNKQKINLKWL